MLPDRVRTNVMPVSLLANKKRNKHRNPMSCVCAIANASSYAE